MAESMIQIVERPGSDLFHRLQAAMRGGDLRTFQVEKRGRKVLHSASPGWMNWTHAEGVIHGTILSPQRKGMEWKLLSALVGRLADRYAADILFMVIHFPTLAGPAAAAGGERRARSARARPVRSRGR